MKAHPSPLPDKSMLRAYEILHGAESTFGRSPCNNAQVSSVQIGSSSFRMLNLLARNSLIEFKSLPDVVSGLFNCSPGKNSEMGHSVPTITGKDYLTLLRPSVREYRHVMHGRRKNGRPSVGPGQRLPMVGFCLPNDKEHGMSHNATFKFLLSG